MCDRRLKRHKQAANRGYARRSCQDSSNATFDVVRIGAWAPLVFAALLVIVGLIGFARGPGT
jgi:hypothetical protein